jgi:predicted GIY-YIG superfamily endonuclease
LFYIYFLISESTGRRYVGHSDDLERRVDEHNSIGHNARKHTSKQRGPNEPRVASAGECLSTARQPRQDQNPTPP